MAAAAVAPKLILDNRVNVSDGFSQLVYYSGVNNNYFSINADGSNFTSQVLYNNIVVPNLSTTLVSRNIRHQYDVVITYDRTSVNAPQLAGVNNWGGNAGAPALGANPYPIDTALRAPFPLQQACSTTQLTINSGSNTINSQIVLDPLARRIARKHLMKQSSECPSMLDNQWQLTTDKGVVAGQGQLTIAGGLANWAAVVEAGKITTAIAGVSVVFDPAQYAATPAVGAVLQLTTNSSQYQAVAQVNTLWADGAEAATNIAVICLYKSASGVSDQPLSCYQNSCGGWTRGSFLPYKVGLNGNLVSLTFNVVEQVYISPLTLQDKEVFLANINTLSMLFNFSSLTRMFESSNANAAFTVALANPHLLLEYIQINPEVSSIPRSVSYNYDDIVYFSKTFTAQTLPQNLQTDTVRLQAMPSLVMCLARVPITSQGFGVGSSNTFLTFGRDNQSSAAQVSINIGNRTGLMSSATIQDVYRMAVRNGWQSSYNEFLQASSCLCFNPVEDLGVDPSLDTLPLQTGSVNLQIQYPVSGLNYQTATGQPYVGDVELIMVVVYAGVATITTDQLMRNLGALSANEMNAVLAKSDQEGQKYSSEAVQPTIEGQGLASPHKYILGGMNQKHARSKLQL